MTEKYKNCTNDCIILNYFQNLFKLDGLRINRDAEIYSVREKSIRS